MANLAQLRLLEKLDGLLLIDKPSGIAFSTVIKAVKRKFNLVKVGHGGALEAAASGLFILLINDANAFVGHVMGADRAYTGSLRLGRVTNTHDLQGEVLHELATVPPLDPARVDAARRDCRGDVFQTESQFCAVRREGSASYEIADTGAHQPFMAHVYKFDLGERRENSMDFSLSATKGLIVRTLVHDFGACLGCGACLESLRRTRIGAFAVEDAIPFDDILATDLADFPARVIPLSKAFV